MCRISHDYARSEPVLRELEKKYNAPADFEWRGEEGAMTKNALEKMKCINTPSEKMAMQIIIKGVLESKSKKLQINSFLI